MNENRLKIVPLCGADNFAHLMRTKPSAVWQNALVHVVYTLQQTETHVTTNSMFSLGLIVPKKIFPRAVDRNRVRRVARAHARELIKSPLFSATPNKHVQLLLRFRSVKGKNNDPIMPFRANFGAQLFSAMQKALKNASQNTKDCA